MREPTARRGALRHAGWLAALALTALLLLNSRAATEGAVRAMAQFRETVAPALMPFLALLPLLTCAEAARAYERMLGRAARALFCLPGSAAPAMIVGMVAGMPAGALAARRAAAGSGMDRGQLQRMAAAFSGFSPAFLIGGVGAGLLGRAALGWKLWLAQGLTQVTLALLLRRAWTDRRQPVPPLPDAEGDRPPFTALLTVCGYMALFGALNGVVGGYVGRERALPLLCLLDVPSGASGIAALRTDEGTRLVLLAAACGFGGVCVIAQSLSALKGCGVRAGEFVGLRVAAAAIGAGYMALLTRLPGGADGWLAPIHEKPMAAAALVASLAAVPVMARLGREKGKLRIENGE